MTQSRDRRVGDIVMITLGDESYAFAQVLKEPLVAFFDLKATSEVPIEKILSSPVAFSIWVMNHAVTREWKVIGHAEVTPALNQRPAFFKKDRISGDLSITYDGGEEVPASFDEVKGLERAAVWEPSHVVERLNDHFSGKPNVWVERLRP